MKKLFLFAAVMFSVVLFSACTEDDNSACTEDNNKEENQTSQKLLKQIEKINIAESKTVFYNFSYDEHQRLAKVIVEGDICYSNGDFTYTYTDNCVGVKFNSSCGDEYSYDVAFALDHNGYVTKFDFKGETIFRYEYENGYVSKKQNNSVVNPFFFTYRWENGNLIEIGSGSNSNLTTYTYTDKPNKLNINLFDAQFGLCNFDIYALVGFLATNFKGSIPSNYPASVGNNNIYYEYDDEGYPTQIMGPANYILTYY